MTQSQTERVPRAQSPTTPAGQPKKASLRQRWGAVQLSKTVVFWLLVAAMALTMIVGFAGAGWVTGAVAERGANTTAQAAVVERLASICVAQFNQDPQKAARLVELQDTSRFQTGTYVKDQGWATMPGENSADNRVAAACAALLLEQ